MAARIAYCMIALLLMATACSSSTSPSETKKATTEVEVKKCLVREEVCKEAKEHYNRIEEAVNNGKPVAVYHADLLVSFAKKYDEVRNPTGAREEHQLVRSLVVMATAATLYHTARVKEDRESRLKALETYQEAKGVVSKLLGL